MHLGTHMNIVFEVKGPSYHQTKYGYQGADMCIDGFPLSFSSFIDLLILNVLLLITWNNYVLCSLAHVR